MKKKFLLLPIVGAFLLTGCKFSLFGKTISLFEKDEKQDSSKTDDNKDGDGGQDDKPTDIDDVTPEEQTQHATNISMDPNAPFYLKVGETRTISVSLSPSPAQASEKTFTWKSNNSHVSFVEESTTNKINIKGESVGTALVTATNDYNETLTKTFTVKVIDFNEGTDYLWQYASEDRAQFGYNKDSAVAGTAYGVANLNGISWTYSREHEVKDPETGEVQLKGYVSSLHTDNGGLGFGKGGDPETHLHFESESALIVDSFVIEAASAHSLAKMTIKVGGEVYLDEEVVPKAEWDVIGTITSDEPAEKRSGKIEIDVVTPEYDINEAGSNPEYIVPGAFVLKSIMIHFGAEPEIKTTEKFDFKAMYDDAENEVFSGLSASTVKEIKFSQNDFDVTLEKVKKEGSGEDEKIPGYAHTNGYIEVKLNKANEIVYKVELQVQYGSTGDSYKTTYSLESSKSGGAPFTVLNVSGDKTNGLLKVGIIKDNVNCIRLTPSKNNHVGLDYLTIYTRAGVNPTIKSIEVPEDFKPTNSTYNIGDVFDPTGLNDLSIVYNEEGVQPDALPASELEWFDGVSYDSNPEKASKELLEGTTYACGVFRGEKVATVEGLTVAGEKLTLTLVKEASEITASSKYLIVGKYKEGFTCLNGAGTKNDDIKNGYVLSNFELEDSVLLSKTFESRSFTASLDSNSKLHFENSSGNKIALNSSGLTFSKTATNDAWNYVVNSDGRFVMSMEEPAKEFGVNNTSGAFSAYSSTSTAKGVIYLYKFAE